jgi:hypothetical protein
VQILAAVRRLGLRAFGAVVGRYSLEAMAALAVFGAEAHANHAPLPGMGRSQMLVL